VLKFIEERFGLPALSERDANANDMTDSFNSTRSRSPPIVLTRASAAGFGDDVKHGTA